jgi:hypothetical protein
MFVGTIALVSLVPPIEIVRPAKIVATKNARKTTVPIALPMRIVHQAFSSLEDLKFPIVVWVEEKAFVGPLVLEDHVYWISNAHQVNLVVVFIKI